MADVTVETELSWPPLPAGLVVESSNGAPDALLVSFPLVARPKELSELTRAEAAVLDGVLRGLSNAEIARRRGAAVRTVANQLASLFRKLGAHSRLDVALLASGTHGTEPRCPESRTAEPQGRRLRVR
jgi:DNA-binding NarL/FixJ family response regulator